MAVVLRSKTDLVYLPDHGFVGEEGGTRLQHFGELSSLVQLYEY